MFVHVRFECLLFFEGWLFSLNGELLVTRNGKMEEERGVACFLWERKHVV